MAMDPAISDALNGQLLAGANAGTQRLSIAGENLMTALGVIQNLTIQGNATNKDDAATFAALNAADRTPQKKE
jgi:hypothetical protein